MLMCACVDYWTRSTDEYPRSAQAVKKALAHLATWKASTGQSLGAASRLVYQWARDSGRLQHDEVRHMAPNPVLCAQSVFAVCRLDPTHHSYHDRDNYP